MTSEVAGEDDGRSMRRTAAGGATITLGAQGIKMLLQIASVVILARLLTPEDYGLLAIVLLIIGVGEIFRDFGLTTASIQSPTLQRSERDNLFWANTAIGILLAAITFGIAWPLGAITGNPALTSICAALSLMFVFNGLATQYRAMLMREFRFKRMAITEIIAAVVGLVIAIALALLGAGYWALVAQQLATGFVLLVGYVILGHWLPRWYDRSVGIRHFVKFGWNLSAASIVTYIGSQIDTLTVAVRFGATPLGLYNRAYQLIMTPIVQLRSPLTTVALPVLSRIQGDQRRFADYITAGQLALGYGLSVPLGVISALAPSVTAIALGPVWADSAPILRFIAIAALFQNLAYVGYWVYTSRGLGRSLFRYSLVATSIRVACILIGSMWGVVGVAVGFAIAPMIAWPLSIAWLSRITVIPTRRLYGGAARIMLAVVVTGGVALCVQEFSGLAPVWALLAGTGAAVAAGATLMIVPVIRADVGQLVGIVRQVIADRRPPSPEPKTAP